MKNFFLPVLLIMLFQGNLKSQDIISVKVDKVPEKEIDNPVWKKAEAVTIPVSSQNIISPALKEASISSLNVRSINDGEKIGFLIEWTDSTRNALVDVKVYSDQLAIQFPLNPGDYPSFMMGNKGGRVHIIHWKAIWQDDIEKGYRDVKTSHPNYWADLYYFKDKKADTVAFASQLTVKDFNSPAGKNYMHGAYAGNPMSIFDRKTPAEEAIAEGYGTLTTQPQQNAIAWGKWENNQWKVLITRPIRSQDPTDATLSEKGIVGFAVWDGAHANIGAKKHYSMWINLQIAK